MAKKTKSAEPATISVAIEVPLGDPPDGYEADNAERGQVRIEERRKFVGLNLPADDAVFFLRMRNGLREQHAQLADGSHIDSSADVLRWFVQQLRVAMNGQA